MFLASGILQRTDNMMTPKAANVAKPTACKRIKSANKSWRTVVQL
ncbi:hypothetical protein HanPSC8_Chr14g0643421 [Helianthus annuus]|nr:hypothetical protein HanPSC8_Chr14g0643421 [Helianthus annuus]